MGPPLASWFGRNPTSQLGRTKKWGEIDYGTLGGCATSRVLLQDDGPATLGPRGVPTVHCGEATGPSLWLKGLMKKMGREEIKSQTCFVVGWKKNCFTRKH